MRPSGAWRRRRLARRREEARKCTRLPPAASWATPACILRRQPPHAPPKIRHCWERSSSLSDAASPRPIHSDKPEQPPAGSASSPQPFHLHAHTLAALQIHLCTCLEDATNSKIWEKEEDTKREMGSEEERVKLAARHTVAHCCICSFVLPPAGPSRGVEATSVQVMLAPWSGGEAAEQQPIDGYFVYCI